MKVNTEVTTTENTEQTPVKGRAKVSPVVLGISAILVIAVVIAGFGIVKNVQRTKLEKECVTTISESMDLAVDAMGLAFSTDGSEEFEARTAELEAKTTELAKKVEKLNLSDKEEEKFITNVTEQVMEDLSNSDYGSLLVTMLGDDSTAMIEESVRAFLLETDQ